MKQQFKQVQEDFNEDDFALDSQFMLESANEIASKILGRNMFDLTSGRESLSLRSSQERKAQNGGRTGKKRTTTKRTKSPGAEAAGGRAKTGRMRQRRHIFEGQRSE